MLLPSHPPGTEDGDRQWYYDLIASCIKDDPHSRTDEALYCFTTLVLVHTFSKIYVCGLYKLLPPAP